MAGILAWLVGLLPWVWEGIKALWKGWGGVGIPIKIGLLVAAAVLIPMPDWAEALPSKFAALPPVAQYALYVSQLDFGLGVIGAAYALRWGWDIVSGAIKGG